MPCLWKEVIPLATEHTCLLFYLSCEEGAEKKGAGTETECHLTFASKKWL